MSKRLVIVESPAKAKTIAGYLGDDFVVESSVGHIRDLPDSAAEIPEEYKGEPWARLGVDVEHDFEPLYVVDPDKKKKVSELRKLLAGSDELLLATDEDREGEAIAMFPEGTRRRKGLVKRFEARPRSGAARIALEAGVPLVPAAVAGTDRLSRLGPLRVAYGPPIDVDDLGDKDLREAAHEATDRLMKQILELEASL